jgi:arsenite methyltransferase
LAILDASNILDVSIKVDGFTRGVTEMTDKTKSALREEVREHYAQAAQVVLDQAGRTSGGCCGSPAEVSCCDTGSAALDSADWAGAALYGEGGTEGLPEEAVLASLGCGNPVAVADLHEGERVLDLGSGCGIDVLLSARRVGPSGFAYGVDMTEEMLTLSRANAAKAGAANVEFRKGEIEALPLPDAAVDVVISNCVINLSTDKSAVLAEMFRVHLSPRRPRRSCEKRETQGTHRDRDGCSHSVPIPERSNEVTIRREPTSLQLRCGGAGGARTHDRQIMSPLL